MEAVCHPYFSVSGCGWTPTQTDAAHAVFAACLTFTMCSGGSLIGGLVTRATFTGVRYDLLTEGALGALIACALHVVLWLGAVIGAGASASAPYPLWLNILFWTLPFALTLRVQYLCFLTMYVPEKPAAPFRVSRFAVFLRLAGARRVCGRFWVQ